jgi:glycosyltransferase involved in cell wall biosynthesis
MTMSRVDASFCRYEMRPRRILHVITDLYVGGAETMLMRLATAKPGLAEDTLVVSLLPDGLLAERLRAAGITVVEHNFRQPFGIIAGMIRLARLIAKTRPDIVQGWMYHGDLAALVALALSGRRNATRLAWNIRCSNLDLTQYGRLLRLVVRACVRLSSSPDLVIANSAAGMDVHRALGYRPRRAEVVPNGIDIEQYKPDAAARAAVRGELGIPDDAILLAHVARLDPMKDHAGFLAVMAKLPDVEALVIGAGTESLPAAANVHRLGRRTDMPRLFAAADFVVSTSAFGEGFSNALAEGMACGLPPIATAVGDAPIIIGDTGVIVPPRDPGAFADAARALMRESRDQRAERGTRARRRIVENYSLERAQRRFAEIYASLLEK